MWEGGDCWIVGGGPSIPVEFDVPRKKIQQVQSGQASPSIYSDYMSAIHDKHVIGINAAFLVGGWMDMIFFGDKRFFLDNLVGLTNYNKPLVSCHNYFNGGPYSWVKYVQKDNRHPSGISDVPTSVSWNQNSGAAAISIAANAGVKRIILLGFDMALNGNKEQHWHSHYKGGTPRAGKKRRKDPFGRHLRGFSNIAIDANKRGIEIINASPNSTIVQFMKISVKELL